jgi:hypothetical protein
MSLDSGSVNPVNCPRTVPYLRPSDWSSVLDSSLGKLSISISMSLAVLNIAERKTVKLPTGKSSVVDPDLVGIILPDQDPYSFQLLVLTC